jgi:hypothetical protein
MALPVVAGTAAALVPGFLYGSQFIFYVLLELAGIRKE